MQVKICPNTGCVSLTTIIIWRLQCHLIVVFYFLFLLLFLTYYIPFSMTSRIVGSITVGAYARILRHRRQVKSGANTRKRLDPLRVDSRLY
jgi:hypothetical protein